MLKSAGSRKPPAAGKGRKKGVPNKATTDVRMAMALLAQNNVDKLQTWLVRTARKQPAKAAELFLRALEFHVPKLVRSQIVGDPSAPIVGMVITTDDPIEAGRQYQRMVNGS